MTVMESSKILSALYSQIEEICAQFSAIRSEAEVIVSTSQMPDAALHLNDVLQATEQATHTILDATTKIGTLVDASAIAFETKEEISEEVGRIYEACSFEDLSGQRIKKVLQHLKALEDNLQSLSMTAQKHRVSSQKPPEGLLNGPQLSACTPSQSEVDQLFADSRRTD